MCIRDRCHDNPQAMGGCCPKKRDPKDVDKPGAQKSSGGQPTEAEREEMRKKSAEAAERRAAQDKNRGMKNPGAHERAENRDRARANLEQTQRENEQRRYD
eukprot:TRINITY_DN12778_c0_g1_i5.p1 TRINITY_DN12778_c0_g1~~TRINITY_DN12778_c0_g1_i5.p1  ORF type:complete len:101 (+),score=19.51 TRINITY_DN12778_c0_g1_i5:172-474(+)